MTLSKGDLLSKLDRKTGERITRGESYVDYEVANDVVYESEEVDGKRDTFVTLRLKVLK